MYIKKMCLFVSVLLYTEHVHNEIECKKKLLSYVEEHSESYPMSLGEYSLHWWLISTWLNL